MTGADGNAVDYFVDRHLREGRGERLAVADPWRSLTYAELAAASARFAAGLRAAGIERERRIALVVLDTVDFPIRVLGRHARRDRAGADQYALAARHHRLHPRRQPRRGGHRLGAAAGSAAPRLKLGFGTAG